MLDSIIRTTDALGSRKCQAPVRCATKLGRLRFDRSLNMARHSSPNVTNEGSWWMRDREAQTASLAPFSMEDSRHVPLRRETMCNKTDSLVLYEAFVIVTRQLLEMSRYIPDVASNDENPH